MLRHILSAALFACLVTSACAAVNDAFVGDWNFNASASTPDKMTVERIGADKYTFNFGGGPETVVVDGTDQPSRLYGGGSLCVAVDGDTWKVIRKSSNGRVLLSATWSVSADGRTLTDRYTGFNDDGSRYTQIYTYKRTGEGSRFAGTWISTSQEALGFVLGLQIRPFEEGGLSIIDASSQIMGNMNFPSFLVRGLDERTLELLRKKGEVEPSVVLHLQLSRDLRRLTITPHSAAEPHILAFDRA